MSIVVLDREECPTCGQAVNWRKIPLTTQMVGALMSVFWLCIKTGQHEFQRKEIDKELKIGTQYANFGYWKWFSSGAVYTPIWTEGKKKGQSKGRGWWGFNLDRMRDFFSGRTKVYSIIYTRYKGAKREIMKDGLITIRDIPDIQQFMEGDEYKEYVVQYYDNV